MRCDGVVSCFKSLGDDLFFFGKPWNLLVIFFGGVGVIGYKDSWQCRIHCFFFEPANRVDKLISKPMRGAISICSPSDTSEARLFWEDSPYCINYSRSEMKSCAIPIFEARRL